MSEYPSDLDHTPRFLCLLSAGSIAGTLAWIGDGMRQFTYKAVQVVTTVVN
jgi:hypothetical protein